MLQFLGASELALKQCFPFPKHYITINDSSLTTSLQRRSVAKHQEHRFRNKRKMWNDMVETTKRKEPSTPHTDISRWVSDWKYFQNEGTSLSSWATKLSSPKTPLPVSPFSLCLLNPLNDWCQIFTSWKWACPLLFATQLGIFDCNLTEVNKRPYITKRKRLNVVKLYHWLVHNFSLILRFAQIYWDPSIHSLGLKFLLYECWLFPRVLFPLLYPHSLF